MSQKWVSYGGWEQVEQVSIQLLRVYLWMGVAGTSILSQHTTFESVSLDGSSWDKHPKSNTLSALLLHPNTYDACHVKTDLKVFVVIIPKEG